MQRPIARFKRLILDTGEVLADVQVCTRKDIDRAVESAQQGRKSSGAEMSGDSTFAYFEQGCCHPP